MDFVLRFNLDNAEFDGFSEVPTFRSADAVAKYLQLVANGLRDRFENLQATDTAAIRDVNGNTIGSWSVEK